MTRRYAAQCFAGGLLAGFGIMFAYGLRVVLAIHTGHRWGQTREFLGVGRKH